MIEDKVTVSPQFPSTLCSTRVKHPVHSQDYLTSL